jgi:mRNA interferase MazF
MSAHDAGDISWADLDPVRGTEQGMRRPVLIITPSAYNDKAKRAVVCPISSGGVDWPFNLAVPAGLKTQGVVLVDQVRAVHCEARLFRKIENVPASFLHDVRVMLATILGIDLSAVSGVADV